MCVKISNPNTFKRLSFTTLRPSKRFWNWHSPNAFSGPCPAKNPSSRSSKKEESEILKLDESCISDPKFRNFGFEMQDSSNFKISDSPSPFSSIDLRWPHR